jgi:hypothetical protein
MCDKCSTINKTIERFRQIRRSISDQLTVERARQVIAELEEQKAVLHFGDCEPTPPAQQGRDRQSDAGSEIFA